MPDNNSSPDYGDYTEELSQTLHRLEVDSPDELASELIRNAKDTPSDEVEEYISTYVDEFSRIAQEDYAEAYVDVCNRLANLGELHLEEPRDNSKLNPKQLAREDFILLSSPS